jgi:NADPH-dependent curcumin reductase CurA
VSQNRRIVLAARPIGLPKESDFRLETVPIPEPADGEVLVRTLYLSLDPYMRVRMSEGRSYASPIALGEVMIGGAVGEVERSRDRRFAPGDLVEGRVGWQEFGAVPGGSLRPVDCGLGPISTALGVLGMTGLTAYFGLLEIGRPRPGDTVVVTAAAGAVGSIAGQIARLAGCRTVGIAGGADKARSLRDRFGFDHALDYKAADDLAGAIAAAAPHGVDVFFDNVGGVIADAVMDNLARGARIVVCGTVSQTSLARPEFGPRAQAKLMAAWASMQAFNVYQFRDRHEEARARLAAWLRSGQIQHREDIVDGLDRAPRAFTGMLRGENSGKLLVRVAARKAAP